MEQVIEYESPQICICGAFLCEGIMADVSCWPTIKAGTPKYYEFEDYGADLETQNGLDVAIF
jgi:hypothetical protein